jgi:cytochrome c5
MKPFPIRNPHSAALLAATLALATSLCVAFGDSPTNSVPAGANPPAAAKAPGRKPLTGAELYSIHCNRCHPERYPTERTAAQWKTIMLHMQVRVNLPAKQAHLILQYLQENSGR